MMNQTQIPIPLNVSYQDKKSVGCCQVEFHTRGSAVRKGLTAFILTLLAASVSILLPGLHFITVPLGIVASPFVGAYFFITSKGRMKRMDGEFSCPECQAINHVSFRGIPPYNFNCVQCLNELRIAPLLPDSGS